MRFYPIANGGYMSRKKKCDRCYPVCGHCTRLNLICERESPRSVRQASQQRTAAPTAASALTAPSSCIDATPLLTGLAFDGDLSRSDPSSSRRAMLRYYTTSFAAMLSTNYENNCFLSGLCALD
ncbi:hypothetical protein PFICI_06097 [Pestalotiopsis fici W106-1]|uniref:Zn(2)-C6 fungal-type domain-containing protein n=1 Tax=Pestalotiopsis fici (strain W106-1 / CGMCC3.15140) TaxID=1229662 RepID=W3X4W2_PESFW|nr:uncharacterized protein PFICI_06097 [Pestalotiopsis fici W106-1]ETS81095.1 hypothetical protein PFICI_06097 [Pestalotiopsis fici W106-1]